LPNYFLSQSVGADVQDNPFMQRVPSVDLSKQTVIDGVALLGQTTTHVAVAIEFPWHRRSLLPHHLLGLLILGLLPAH
jgi:hypothetical protein